MRASRLIQAARCMHRVEKTALNTASFCLKTADSGLTTLSGALYCSLQKSFHPGQYVAMEGMSQPPDELALSQEMAVSLFSTEGVLTTWSCQHFI